MTDTAANFEMAVGPTSCLDAIQALGDRARAEGFQPLSVGFTPLAIASEVIRQRLDGESLYGQDQSNSSRLSRVLQQLRLSRGQVGLDTDRLTPALEQLIEEGEIIELRAPIAGAQSQEPAELVTVYCSTS